MRVTTKGQVTIPRHIREQLGVFPHSEVEFVVEGNTVVLRKAQDNASRGRRLVALLLGGATVRMSTDEIMAMTGGDEIFLSAPCRSRGPDADHPRRLPLSNLLPQVADHRPGLTF